MGRGSVIRPYPIRRPPPYGAATFKDIVGRRDRMERGSRDATDFLEVPPDSPEKIAAEIQRCEAALPKVTAPQLQAHYRRRLEVLRSAKLGVEPSPRPRRKRPDTGQEALYWRTPQERVQKYEEYLEAYPGAVEYVERATKWNDQGVPIEYETVRRVAPEVHKLIEEALRDTNGDRNDWLRRQMAHEAAEQRAKAEYGPDWIKSPAAARAQSQRYRDWAADPEGDPYSCWPAHMRR
jgi:hypothetical protein